MRLSQYIDRQPVKRRKSPAKSAGGLKAIAAHRAFVPLVTVWGAALLGLALAVLPAEAINRITVLTGLGMLGGFAKAAYSIVAAILGGGIAYFAAGSAHERASASDESVSLVSAVQSRRIRPINPATDLGSDSLDAPIDESDFASDEEEGEFEELKADPVPALGAQLAPLSEKRQPTLGELAERNYELEAPEEAAEDSDASEDGGDALFTRKHFQSALIEACDAETCEAQTCEAGSCEPASAEEKGEDVAEVEAESHSEDEPGPIGRPGSSGAWSLTQFTPPSPDAAPDQPPAALLAAKPVRKEADIAPIRVVPDPEPAEAADRPRALDLGEFAEMPGRNAVWVEEVEESPNKATPESAPAPSSALEKLRQKNPEDLSLVEMVERFAGALHEHQQSERARRPETGPARDAALAEALKALTLFTERGFDKGAANADTSQLGETERELRDALTKLQTLRGETRGAA